MAFTPYQTTIHLGSNRRGEVLKELVAEILKVKGGKAHGWTEGRIMRVGIVLLAKQLGIAIPPEILRVNKKEKKAVNDRAAD